KARIEKIAVFRSLISRQPAREDGRQDRHENRHENQKKTSMYASQVRGKQEKSKFLQSPREPICHLKNNNPYNQQKEQLSCERAKWHGVPLDHICHTHRERKSHIERVFGESRPIRRDERSANAKTKDDCQSQPI